MAEARLIYEREELNLIKFFPALARRSLRSLKEAICDFIADNLLLDRIELKASIKALRDTTEAEHLRKRRRNGEWRTRLFLAHDGEEKVLVMI
jgi:hypothetical protein